MPEFGVGTTLRTRRQQLGLSLDAVALDTNIRAKLLAAIEEGNFNEYPPRGHAAGIISSYARYLKLDPKPLIAQFQSEYDAYLASAEMAASADRTRRGVGRFGEQVPSDAAKPSPRSASAKPGQGRTRKRGQSQSPDSTGSISAGLQSEQIAENDDRYVSGSVRVLDKRQTRRFDRTRPDPTRVARQRFEDYDADKRSSTQSSSSTQNASSKRCPEGSSLRSAGQSYIKRSGTAYHDDANTPAASLGESTGDYEGAGARRSSGRVYRSSRASYTKSIRSTADAGEQQNSDTGRNFFGVEIAQDGQSGSMPKSRKYSRRAPAQQECTANTANQTVFGRLIERLKEIFSERRTRIIAIVFILLLLGVIIAASVLIATAGSARGGVIEVDGGAVNDTTTSDDENTASKTITTANGNPVTIRIEVAEGETSLISVTYDDANAYSGTAVGPFSREFLVTETFNATFGNPDAVTVTENGNEISLTINEDGTGSLNVSIQAAPGTGTTMQQTDETDVVEESGDVAEEAAQ